MRAVAPSIILCAVILTAIIATQLRPTKTGPFIAAFNPQAGEGALWDALRDADAYLLNEAGLPGVYVVWSESPQGAERLRAAGAYLVLNAAGAAGCGGLVNKRGTPFVETKEGRT